MGIKRRDFLMGSAAALAAAASSAKEAAGSNLGSSSLPVRVGMTDWNLGQRGDVSKVALAREIGLDGIQVSIMFPEDGSLHLRDEKLQAEYRNAALENGIQICSLAIGNLGPGSPFKSEPMGVLRVADAIKVARNLGTNNILLPLFRKSAPDFSNKTEVNRIINSFKELMPLAEKMGVVLSMETSWTAEQHLQILEAVDSPYLGVYFDPFNAAYFGFDPFRDLEMLKDWIHQVHVKNGKSLLSDPCEQGFSWPGIAELLYKIGYKGWLVLETSKPHDLIADTRANIEYVKKHFRMA